LADVIVGLYDSYMAEVALMTAEGFAQSPLSRANDLRSEQRCNGCSSSDATKNRCRKR